MTLKEFLKKERYTVTELAKQLEYSRSYINLIVTGKQKPSKTIAEKIRIFTKGKVRLKA